MNLIQTLFIMQLIIFLLIFFAKIYNILALAQYYKIQIAVILHIITIICFMVGQLSLLNGYSIIMIAQIFRMEIWLYYFIWLFFLFEIFLYIGYPKFYSSNQYRANQEK